MVKFNLGMLKNKEMKNAGWIIGERVLQMLLSLIIGSLSARYLGPQNYGALNYTASFVTFFTSIATLGMDGVIIKKMIADPEHEGDYLGGCALLRFISSVLSSASILVIVFFLNLNEPEKLLLAALQSLQLLFNAFNILDAWFRRYLKSKYISIGKCIAYITVMIYKFVLIVTSKSIEWFAFANSLSSLSIAILLFVFYKKNNGQRINFNFSYGFSVLKDSYHYILSGLMVSIYGQMDKIMIGKMLSDTQVGLYTTATAICTMWNFVPSAIIHSLLPGIVELKEKNDEEGYEKRLSQLYSIIIWMCLLVSLIIFVAAPLIIFMLYGSEYSGALNTLRIAIWFEVFSMIGVVRDVWVLCEDKNKYVKYFLGIGAVINLILNAMLIPTLGIEGAAIATLITQISTSILSPAIFKNTRTNLKFVWSGFTFKWYRKRK